MRSVVVLPQPDGPTRTHTSPSGTSSVSSRTATFPFGNCLVTESRRITARPRSATAGYGNRRAGYGDAVVLGAYDGEHAASTGRGSTTTRPRSGSACVEHLTLVGWSLLWGLVLSLPLALLAHRYRHLRGPALSVTGILYTIPSLAAFSLLLPYTGLSQSTAIIPLTTYTLLILVRNVLAGLDGVSGRGARSGGGDGVLAAPPAVRGRAAARGARRSWPACASPR